MTTRVTERSAIDASANIIWNLEDRLRTAHGENLALRAVLAEHGIDVPAPDGVITLTRMRRLEDVMDLAKAYVREGGDELRDQLHEAIIEAGRAP
jgi:hypothetical protein